MIHPHIHTSTQTSATLARQREIHARCFHPTGAFIEFREEETEQSIPDRFEQQVRRHPHRLAVKTRSHELTYDALNQLANRLAQAILAQRGTSDEPIALLLERGSTLMAAILGVLKAGKFYVPLDPAYPHARNAYILEDSQAGLVVTDSKNLVLARDLAQNTRQLLNADELAPSLSTANPGLRLSPDRRAYILYTSGSTGRPKGIVDNHRNLLHEIYKLTNTLHICAEDRQTLVRSASFSGSVKDIFGALLNGAALLPFDLEGEGVAKMGRWLIQEEVTMYRSVATVFRHLAGTLTGEESFPKLRLIYVGGEPLYRSDVESYKKHFSPECIFVNGLGLSEAGTIRMYFMDKKTEVAESIVPVGYPLEGAEILLLDDDGQDVGFQQAGEITIKSRYLSPGYWQRPDLARSVFLPDPEARPERICRTGDLGLKLPDGCLFHLGRKDFQVKIRGSRIETAEIELALQGMHNIREAVVVAQEDRPGSPRLVAYLVPGQKPAPTVTVLRSTLAQKLPSYMVPSAFVILEALPLLLSGKVNRRALPAPDKARPELGTPLIAPRTPEEEQLAEIWAQVLGLEQVGVDDDFLELGGDSLLATQVISRVIKAFNVDLPLRVLFAAPTVAQMTVVVAQHQAEQASPEDVERLLAELEALSEEQANQLLAGEVAGLHQGRPSPQGKQIGRQQ